MLLCAVAANAAGTWTDGQNAVSVLGQPNFSQAVAQAGATGMFQPSSVRFDPVSGKLFVADCANARILRFTNAQAFATGGSAEAVFGQSDFNGVSGGFTQSKIRCVGEMAIDSAGRLWVADTDNNRVLRWDGAASLASGQPASAVLGQPDFTTITAGTTQSKMSSPEGLFIDASGRLWVADTNNNRVLRFENAAGKANGANADGVLGQTDFVTSTGAMTQSGFLVPNSLTGNSAGSLWVSDAANDRVLRFDNAASKANGGNADSILGSTSYTAKTFSGTTSSSMDTPEGLVLDATGRLYVSDGNNSRVLIFNSAASLAPGAAASNVLGQTTFTASAAHLSQNGLDMPYTPAFDEATQSLWVPDLGNNRVMRFSTGAGTPTPTPTPTVTPTPGLASMQFSASNYSVGEGDGHATVTVTRTGDTSGTTSIDYQTVDQQLSGHASQKSDYQMALGTITFAPGETSKTFTVLIVDDTLVEGNEVIDLLLGNPKGPNSTLGIQSTATVTILDNDTVSSPTNPYDDARFFVRQHYLDFLNREPDQSGWDFWTNEITQCGANAQCIEVKRINVSAAYFLSIEFQSTGYETYLTYRSAYGANAFGGPAPVPYTNFMHDVQQLGKGYVFGAPGADAVIEANKVAYFNDFVTRPEFLAKYPNSLTNQQFVDNVLTTANLSPDDYIVNMTNAQEAPGVNPTTSGGQRRDSSYGTAHFVWNAGQTAMTVTGSVSNIDFTNAQTSDGNDNIAGANIAAGASVKPGVNGPIVFGFNGTPFNDNNPNDASLTPSGSGIGGTFSTKWDSSEGNGTTLSAQLSNLRNGHAYINFNTNQFPNGEIRGDMPNLVTFRQSLIDGLNNSTMTRAQVLRAVAENSFLQTREFNSAFVTMEYFGYLRRDPDTSGFNFWLKKLNDFGGNYIAAEMVKAFISATEVRGRFGTP